MRDFSCLIRFVTLLGDGQIKRSNQSKKLFKMLAIVCNPSFSTTRPKKPNSIQNVVVMTNFLSCVLNSQTEKLPGDVQDAE
jgi:hypothetical protein